MKSDDELTNLIEKLTGSSRSKNERETNERERERRIEELCQNLNRYLDTFENKCPFSEEQLRFHVQTINLRYELGNVENAIGNDFFINNLWRTVRAWGMDARGAKLLPLEEFRRLLLRNIDIISVWEDMRIDDEDLEIEEVVDSLWELIDAVRVSRANNPIVSGSKTFHHLLPELIPPIDREYTRRFFMYWQTYFQNYPKTVFKNI